MIPTLLRDSQKTKCLSNANRQTRFGGSERKILLTRRRPLPDSGSPRWADRIWQDVLILAGEEDHFIPFHQAADFEKALVKSRSVSTRVMVYQQLLAAQHDSRRAY